jgi:ribonuclease Y
MVAQTIGGLLVNPQDYDYEGDVKVWDMDSVIMPTLAAKGMAEIKAMTKITENSVFGLLDKIAPYAIYDLGVNALNNNLKKALLEAVEVDFNEIDKAVLPAHVAADFEVDGSHIEIGARLAKKYGEPEVVINSIESHHGDVEAKFLISHLVQAADTLSAARPGARSEILENYIKRIEQLEQICNSYDGVYQSYAMQSGRELRVMVLPDKMDDIAAFKLAKDIKNRIETEMTYPGQIKVSVIREYRAVETAK